MECIDRPKIQDNFYLYINNSWLNNPQNKVAGKNSSTIKLQSDVLKELVLIMKEIILKLDKTEDEKKLSIIWNISQKRLNPWILRQSNYDDLIAELKILDSYIYEECDIIQIAKYLHYSKLNGFSNILNFYCANDFENSKKTSLMLSISGLSLPSKEYYEDDSFKMQRELFIEHLNQINKLIKGEYLSADFSKNVFEFEKELAKYHMTSTQRRKCYDYYTNTTLTNLYKNANTLNSLTEKELNYEKNEQNFMLENDDKVKLEIFFETLYKLYDFRNILINNAKKYNSKCSFCQTYDCDRCKMLESKTENITVIDGDGIRRVMNMILKMDIKKYKSYLQYKIIKAYKNFCTKDLYDAFFNYYGKILFGQKKQLISEMISISFINNYLGELMGKLYVSKQSFDKHKINNMVSKITDTMKKSIIDSDWLSISTKASALTKLSKLSVKIGYPEEWKDYSNLKIQTSDSIIEINKKILKFRYQSFLDKINSMSDKRDWNVLPQQVHANYTRSINQIIVSLSFLQRPFYYKNKNEIDFDINDELDLTNANYDFTMGANYGAIGVIIGHEIVHGYDDVGLKYDADGNLNNWWTDDSKNKFNEKINLMIEQVENYVLKNPATKLNAQLTMGENLADLGGLSLALKSLKEQLNDYSENIKKANIRVFFKSYVNILKKNEIMEQTNNNLINDVHSPGEFRANLIKNFDEFYESFGIKEGDNMYLKPEKRIRMW